MAIVPSWTPPTRLSRVFEIVNESIPRRLTQLSNFPQHKNPPRNVSLAPSNIRTSEPQYNMLDIFDFIVAQGGNPEKIKESQRRRFAPEEAVDEVIALYQDHRASKELPISPRNEY